MKVIIRGVSEEIYGRYVDSKVAEANRKGLSLSRDDGEGEGDIDITIEAPGTIGFAAYEHEMEVWVGDRMYTENAIMLDVGVEDCVSMEVE